MGIILGEVTIRANGKELKTKPGCVLNPGGYTSTQHLGKGKVIGKSYKYSAPSMEMVIAADDDVSVMQINAIRDATLVWEGDNGVSYMMTGASVGDTLASLREESGDISVTFTGDKTVEL